MLKKMIVLLSMSLAVTAFTGCGHEGDDDGDSFCETWLNDVVQMNKLTKNQKADLEKKFTPSCEKVLNEMPACKTETIDYVSCKMNTPSSYFAEQEDLEEKCYEDHSGDDAAIDACVDKLFQKCKSQEQNIRKCNGANEQALEVYYNQAKSPVQTLNETLTSMGLDPDAYLNTDSPALSWTEY
ncbi:MAG: hypothetical protein J6A01_03940 [Proteobacteria bacterium]|nr:hypothetical protein [Pseudomonadota bacterium]